MRLDRKLNSRTAAWLGTLAVIVLLTAAAWVSEVFVHGRLDLTRDQEFTLSPAALKTLNGLKGRVTARVVMSRDLPAQFQQARTRAVDLLREFEARSNGRFTVVFEDPGQDSLKRVAALSMGIEEVQLQEQSRDGMQVKKGFFGLALVQGERKEVFPVLQNLETFEYDLIVRLMRLTRGRPVVGVVEGAENAAYSFVVPGEGTRHGFAANFTALAEGMRQLYVAQVLRLDIIAVPDSVDLLLVAAPRHLSEIEKFRIDQFAMTGKPVIFLTPGMDVDLVSGIGALPAENGYSDLLAAYGVTIRPDMALEPRQWEMVRFGNAEFSTPYPYWVVVGFESLNGDNPVTAGLQSLSFPWTSTLEVKIPAGRGVRVDTLARTSFESWSEIGPQNLYPRELQEYEPDEPRSRPLAVLRTGRLTSRYAAALPDSLPPAEVAAARRESQGEARLLVVGNALFATDFYLAYTHAIANMHFLLNALDYLALDPELIRVRSRQIADAPLDEELVARHRNLAAAVNLIAVPALLLALAAVAALRRRRRRGASE